MSSVDFVMLTRELLDNSFVPLNQVSVIGRLPTATQLIVTSEETLADVFAGAVTMVAGTAGQTNALTL